MACVLVFIYLCVKAPTLVSTLVSGTPTLGAGGLFSLAATAATAVAGFSSGQAALQAPNAAAASPNAYVGPPALAGGGETAPANQFLPRGETSGFPVNAVEGAAAAPQPPASASAFLPAPGAPRPAPAAEAANGAAKKEEHWTVKQYGVEMGW
jgi:hypothetical protein